MAHQHSLFGPELRLPSGFRYQSGLISPDEETDLLQRLSGLPFRAFEFHGYVGKRRVISFGWEYHFSRETVRRAEAIPAFLLPLREKAATFAGLASVDLLHLLVTEYTTGATIGWHKDKGVFGDVIGISLGSPCTFRLRRRTGARWERASLALEPRSAYLLRGPARTDWEHSIPAAERLRYSITFRTLSPQSGSQDP